MSYENMLPLPDYDGGPADRLRDRSKVVTETDWVQTEHRVILEEETLAQYSNEITIDDIIKAGIFALRAGNRVQFVESECIDGGF